MKTAKSQQGFTLIELIVVIVILGILAVTAAPKFISITSDAKAAQRNGVIGAVRSAFTLGNAKAAIAGLATTSGEATINGKEVNIVNGYPSVAADTGADGTAGKAYNILHILDLDGTSVFEGATTTDATRASTGITLLTISLASDCTITIADSTEAGVAPTIGGSTTCA